MILGGSHTWYMVARRQVVEGESGESCRVGPRVPTWGMVMEYVVKSCTGHPSTPKGGSPEYRNGPWYKARQGRRQGDSMGKEKMYGRGPYADKKMRFTTLEQKLSAIKKWYDEVLKDSRIANPARNARLEKVRGVWSGEGRGRMRGGGGAAVSPPPPWCTLAGNEDDGTQVHTQSPPFA